MSKRAVSLLAIGACCASIPAIGEEFSQSVSARLDVVDFEYREFHDGDRLNRERGVLPGVSLHWQGLWEHVLAEGQLTYWQGDVVYDGKTQRGASVRTRTDELVLDAGGRLGRCFGCGNKLEFQTLIGLGYREWQRDIQSTARAAGLAETYHWWYVSFDARAQYEFSDRVHGLLTARLLQPVNPRVEVDFETLLDSATLNMEEENGFYLAVAWRYRAWESFVLGTELFYQAWDLGRSRSETLTRNGTAIGTVFEPASETRISGARLFFTRHF